jgi:hypothetical protein
VSSEEGSESSSYSDPRATSSFGWCQPPFERRCSYEPMKSSSSRDSGVPAARRVLQLGVAPAEAEGPEQVLGAIVSHAAIV